MTASDRTFRKVPHARAREEVYRKTGSIREPGTDEGTSWGRTAPARTPLPPTRARAREDHPSVEGIALSPRDVALAELIAELAAGRAVELLQDESRATTHGLVTAAELARELGVSRRFVYEHSQDLQAVRLGTGSRARLRFDVEAAREATQRYGSGKSQGENPHDDADRGRSRPRSPARLPNHLPQPGLILANRALAAQNGGEGAAGSILQSRPPRKVS